MSGRWQRVKLELIVSSLAITTHLHDQLWHVFGILCTAGLLLGLLLWALNVQVIGYILFRTPLGAGEKLSFLWSTCRELLQAYPIGQSVSMVLFSLLFSLNIWLLVFVLRHSPRSTPKGSSVFGGLLAIIGAGCAACGTSLIAPFAATLGAGTVTAVERASVWFYWIGSALVLYALVKLGVIIATIRSENA